MNWRSLGMEYHPRYACTTIGGRWNQTGLYTTPHAPKFDVEVIQLDRPEWTKKSSRVYQQLTGMVLRLRFAVRGFVLLLRVWFFSAYCRNGPFHGLQGGFSSTIVISSVTDPSCNHEDPPYDWCLTAINQQQAFVFSWSVLVANRLKINTATDPRHSTHLRKLVENELRKANYASTSGNDRCDPQYHLQAWLPVSLQLLSST